jgi:hypothetical protein
MSYSKHGEYNLKSINKGDLDLSGVGKENEDEIKNTEAPRSPRLSLVDSNSPD